MDLYAENILDHYRHPRQQGALPSPTVTHEERNISCGDELSIHLILDDDHIRDVAWTGTGCAISQAGMSMLAEGLIGKATTEIGAMTPKTMFDLLGVPIGARRLKCALLSLHVLKNALHKAKSEEPQGWNITTQDA